MLWLLPVLLAVGLFVPGFFVAKGLRQPLWWASAFPISLLILFHSVFWLGVFHVPIRLGTVLPCLLAASAAAAWLGRKSPLAARVKGEKAGLTADRALLAASGVVGAVLVARTAVSPLLGFDTLFRWNFLAQRILALGRFDFYPPLTPADFRSYFFVDGIPPMVSFANWWLYASAGRYLPALICILVGAQFACTLAFTFGAASELYSRRAGAIAAAILAACPLYFRSVVIGQETGLTALAIAATIYFIVTARSDDDAGAMVSAGLAAALGALSREYGWIALIAGAVALLWRRQPRRQVVIFAAVAIACAAPWCVRNLVRAGNPFYSLPFAGFAVNPIHQGILERYQAVLGVPHWTMGTVAEILEMLLPLAALQVLVGIPGGFTRFRERGYLIVIAALLTAVWIQSVGYTSAGLEISMRVLSPVMVVLSITAAGLLEPLTRRDPWREPVLGAIFLCLLGTAVQGALYPNNPFDLPLGQWARSSFQQVLPPTEFQIRDQLAQALPPGSRVLTDNAYLHAALVDQGIDVTPVWSPEVRFLFSAPPEEADRQLRALHIGTLVYYPQSLNTGYLTSASPFYGALPGRWRVLADVQGVLTILVSGTP